MAASVIGALRVTLAMNAGTFTKGAKGVVGVVGRLDRAFTHLATAAAGMTVAATAAATVLATKMTRASLTAIDAQAKLARRVGGTVTAIQALERAGDLAGVSGTMLAKAAEKFNERLGEAERRGIGPAAEALDRLGLSASTLIGLDVDERMAVLADRFHELGLTAAAQADVLKDFGVRNKELINLFEGGGAAIRAARAEIQSFGIAVSDVDARKIEMANDAMTKIGLTFKAIGNRLAVELAPFIIGIADSLGEAAKQSHGFSGAIADAIGAAVKGVGFFLDEIYRTRIDWDTLVADILRGANRIIRATNAITQKYTSAWIPVIKEIQHNYGNLRDKLGERLPSEALDEWVMTVRQRAQEAAEALAKSTSSLGGGDGGGGGLSERQQAELDAQRAFSESKLEQLKTSLATERELEMQMYQQRLQDLALFEEQKQLTQGEARNLRERVEREHLDNLAQFNAANAVEIGRRYGDMGRRIGGTFSALSKVIGGESDKQFGILKAASVATALLKSLEAITSSYAAGAAIGGPPVGAAYAAIAAATTAAQIAAIAGVGPGSSGSPSSAGGGGQSAAAAQAQAAPPPGVSQTLQVTGLSKSEFLDGETVRSFAEQLVDFQRDGGTVVFA